MFSSRFAASSSSLYSNQISRFALVLTTAILLVVPVLPIRAGTVEDINGVIHVKNGSSPAEGVVSIELEERWSAGEDDDDIIFGSINAATMDSKGNLYLLDAQLSQVHVYDPDGGFVKTLSREGDGPGEIRRPDDILIMPDGSIGVVHFMSGRIVCFDYDGLPVRSITPGGDPTEGGMRSMRNLRYRGDNLVGCGGMMEFDQASGTGRRTEFIARYNEDGSEQFRYYETSRDMELGRREFNEKKNYFPNDDRWALGPDGNVYTAPKRDAYEIHVYDPDGTLMRVIHRDYQPRKRTQEEKDAVIEGVVMIINGERVVPDAVIEDHATCITAIHVMDDGMVWVRNGHGSHDQPDGVFQTWDVFDADGNFVRQVSLTCDGNVRDDGFFFLNNDTVLLSRGMRSSWLGMFGGSGGDEEDSSPVSGVVCYRLPS